MLSKHKLSTMKRLKRALRPSSAIQGVSRKRLMVNFAESHGLVYFGYVNQRTDDHRLVRGMTASPTHRDNHYCIGSVDGYDVVLVERETEVAYPGKQTHATTWTILAVDLRRNTDMPHVFFDSGPRNETFYANLFTKFSKLKQTDLSVLASHDADFARSYTVYTPVDRFLDAEKIFTPEITSSLGRHFRPLDIEVDGDTLYLYADNLPLTPDLLDAMLKNGLWLAGQLDSITLVDNTEQAS